MWSWTRSHRWTVHAWRTLLTRPARTWWTHAWRWHPLRSYTLRRTHHHPRTVVLLRMLRVLWMLRMLLMRWHWWLMLMRIMRTLTLTLLRSRSWTCLTLRLKLVQSLFRRKRHYWVLAMQFLFWQSFHAYPHTLLRTQRYYAETLGLSVCSIFKEFYFNEIGYADTLYSIGYVLIACPPS